MQCPQCGKEGTGQFCTSCGARLEPDATTASSDPAATMVLDGGWRTAVAAPPAAVMPAPATYPVTLMIEPPSSSQRLWAVPLLGFFVKAIILIPHFVVLYLLGLAVGVLQLVLWIPVLSSGRYPDWAHSFVSGTLRWSVRVQSYFLGLTDQYPPFGPQEGEGTASYPVRVSFEPQVTYNRMWAIPLFGLLVKAVLLIPHLLILYLLGLAVVILQLILWAPVLLTGKYPSWAYGFVGGYLRWSLRTSAYLFGLTDKYPPFQLA